MVTGEYKVPIDVDLHMIFPHAHSLCTALSAVAVRPDGTREPLISIEHFDENWHESIRLPPPSSIAERHAGFDDLRVRQHRQKPAEP